MTIPATELIWMDGALVPWERATVHVLTHALHYGSSVFEGVRVYATPRGPCFFRLAGHLRRFHDSARVHRMPLPFDRAALDEACHAVVRANGLESAYVRPLAFRGYGTLEVDPSACPTQVIVAAIPLGTLLGKQALEDGIDVCVSSWQRVAPNTIPAQAKAGGNYLSSTLVLLEAKRLGFQEGLALGTDGTLAEGSGENVFLVRDGVVHTPPSAGGILAGLTRDTVIRLARHLGHELREGPIAREALYAADELFLTGTAAEVTPVRSVDGLPVGDGRRGPVTAELQRAFFGLFDGATADEWGWLEPLRG